MNTLTLQKETTRIEKAIKKASRVLLEFEIAQSEWDLKQGRFKIYNSAKSLMRAIRRRTQ